MTPTEAVDPHYAGQAGSPAFVIQLDFSSVTALECALRPHGPLAPICDASLFPTLADKTPRQESMLRRVYALNSPTSGIQERIAYLVTYEGPAENEQAWLTNYIDRHRVILSKLPKLRGLEIFTTATTISGLPFPVARSLQRNKTTFESTEDMRAAMLSPVRDELRHDFHQLPTYSGASLHFPFLDVPIETGKRSAPG